jgi:hypothetical protein
MITRTQLLPSLAVALSAALLANAALAQAYCFHSGSTLVAASWSPGPIPLGCAGAPAWPSWRQYVPQHRAPAPHVGFQPGRGEAVPVIVVQYRCTGFVLNPIVPSGYVAMGYVIDMPEYPCH